MEERTTFNKANYKNWKLWKKNHIRMRLGSKFEGSFKKSLFKVDRRLTFKLKLNCFEQLRPDRCVHNDEAVLFKFD